MMPTLWPKVNESWEECVKFCEKQFDATNDRFKNDWTDELWSSRKSIVERENEAFTGV
jgi:hypothetical protein